LKNCSERRFQDHLHKKAQFLVVIVELEPLLENNRFIYSNLFAKKKKQPYYGASFVEGSCKVSNLLEDIQALEDGNILIKNMMEVLHYASDNK
jgi:hypothetical protein